MQTRSIVLLALALCGLSGCIYGPDYTTRPGVVYDDGTAVYAPATGYSGAYLGPGYDADPWCCYGGFWPWIGLNYYGGYYYGGGHHGHGDHNWHGARSGLAPRTLPGAHVAPRISHSPNTQRAHRQ